MKKKLFLIVSVCLCILGTTACSKTDPATVDYNGYSYEELKTNCQGTISALVSMGEEDKSYYLQNGSDVIKELIDTWDQTTEEFGSFVSLDEFEINKSGKTLTVEQTVQLENRPVLVTCVYKYTTMELEDITVDPVYAVSERMSTAGMNTLMGIGTVFAVLILISLIIYAFKLIPYFTEKNRKAEQPVTKPEVPGAAVAPATAQPEETGINEEIIAAIAAAVAAYEGTSADDFVVRSIKRR